MHKVTVEDVARWPQRLFEDAERGASLLVTPLGELQRELAAFGA